MFLLWKNISQAGEWLGNKQHLKKNPGLGALLLVWYLAIWSSASTHINHISLVLYHLWKNLCGICNFYIFVYWDQDAHNLFPLALPAMCRKNFRACNDFPFITSFASGPYRCFLIQCPQLLFFFCLRSASFRAWWSSWHLWQYNPYSDKATKRDTTTTNYRQLFDTANKQTYKTTKYQSCSWLSVNCYSIVV